MNWSNSAFSCFELSVLLRQCAGSGEDCGERGANHHGAAVHGILFLGGPQLPAGDGG